MAKKKEPMKATIFTGFSKRKDFKLNAPFSCYICKRHDGEQSVRMNIVKSKYDVSVHKLRVQPFAKKDHNDQLTYPICIECYGLLSRFSEFKFFSKEHPLPKKTTK